MMHKFYFRFQWVGVFILPLAIIYVPNFLGIKTDWAFPALPYVVALILFAILLSIAVLTTSSSKISNKNYLTLRVTTLIESSYTALVALLLTQGTAPTSNSMIVSVLLDRGINETTAWLANDITRGILYGLLFLFLTTALFSAIVERLSFKHRSIKIYEVPVAGDNELNNDTR